ncbi:hypothetical protein CBL_07674 [Carabus blaptoides fortunei]
MLHHRRLASPTVAVDLSIDYADGVLRDTNPRPGAHSHYMHTTETYRTACMYYDNKLMKQNTVLSGVGTWNKHGQYSNYNTLNNDSTTLAAAKDMQGCCDRHSVSPVGSIKPNTKLIWMLVITLVDKPS